AAAPAPPVPGPSTHRWPWTRRAIRRAFARTRRAFASAARGRSHPPRPLERALGAALRLSSRTNAARAGGSVAAIPHRSGVAPGGAGDLAAIETRRAGARDARLIAPRRAFESSRGTRLIASRPAFESSRCARLVAPRPAFESSRGTRLVASR